jgi:hypothetical protein
MASVRASPWSHAATGADRRAHPGQLVGFRADDGRDPGLGQRLECPAAQGAGSVEGDEGEWIGRSRPPGGGVPGELQLADRVARGLQASDVLADGALAEMQGRSTAASFGLQRLS